ncbi:MAG: AMP-binding protein [Eubacterium sp.]|nr:AMP-binding protein [Eubacterium sp.]
MNIPKDMPISGFIDVKEDKNGALKEISFKNEASFNFAFDIVDAIAESEPGRRAMIHISRDKTERVYTFGDMKRHSARVANYLRFLGIKKGDRVMLVLKRHYQFWFAILALHKIGAVAVPASNLLLKNDFEYRFKKGRIDAILCTADGEVSYEVDKAAKTYKGLRAKIMVGGKRQGWRSLNRDVKYFSSHFPKPEGEDYACGDDPMVMFFTSGTTEYPKLAMHSYRYPLGHYITAKYWHHVDPEGIHFAISDTGWGKALWGKLYGQWMCGTCVFTYDFDKFDAKDILRMIEKYKITTFCAPPTVYRVLVHMKLEKYDLSSLKYVTTAGEALNPEIYERFKEKTGLSLMEGFGQTETTLTVGNLYGMTPRPGSMGKPSPMYDISLMLPDGTEAESYEEGEIVIYTGDPKLGKVHPPNGLFLGYYDDEEKTAGVWHDGYYHTGDTAYVDDDGYLWYVGRTDDLIKSSGYRIGPFEIENEIMKLPYVLECAVTAVPDPIRGQAIKASIVLANGIEASDKLRADIMKSLKKNIASYKWPKVLDFTPELPKTFSGKVKRRDIRDRDYASDEKEE